MSSRLQSGNLRNSPDVQELLYVMEKVWHDLKLHVIRSMFKASCHNFKGLLLTSHPSSLQLA